MKRTLIKAAGLIDVNKGAFVPDLGLMVVGDVIEGFRPVETEHSDSDQVIDLGGLTLLPGLIDAHMHFWGVDSSAGYGPFFLESHAYQALSSVRDALSTLEAGFTSVRCLGSFVDLVLARAIDEGLCPGPRIVGAGPFIMQRGGTWDNPDLPEEWVEGLDMFADGEDECRRIVRRRIRAGAGVIKVGLSSGHFGDVQAMWGDDPSSAVANYTLSEVQALTEEARKADVKVSAHAIGDPAVNLALDGGVDVIEHGHAISDETRRRALDSGVTMVSTLCAQHLWIENGPSYGLSEASIEVARHHFDEQVRSMQRSLEFGIPYALGSDFIGQPVWPHGENATEYEIATTVVGMNPADVLRAGLLQGAWVLGAQDRVGTLEDGKLADIIAVDGNPLNDIRALKRVRFVMKGGKVVLNRRAG